MSEEHVDTLTIACSELAELEAERDQWRGHTETALRKITEYRTRAEAAEARLAAIKALCEGAERQGAPYSVDCDAVLALIGEQA